jgi:hypothetical protein
MVVTIERKLVRNPATIPLSISKGHGLLSQSEFYGSNPFPCPKAFQAEHNIITPEATPVSPKYWQHFHKRNHDEFPITILVLIHRTTVYGNEMINQLH